MALASGSSWKNRRLLMRFGPATFTAAVWGNVFFNRPNLVRLVVYALNESDDCEMPTDYVALRFENGLIEYALVRCNLMGHRLRNYIIGAIPSFFVFDIDRVKTALPHCGGGAPLQVAFPPWEGDGDEHDWTIEKPWLQSDLLKSEEMSMTAMLLPKFQRLVEGPLWPVESKKPWDIVPSIVPAPDVVKADVTTIGTAKALAQSALAGPLALADGPAPAPVVRRACRGPPAVGDGVAAPA